LAETSYQPSERLIEFLRREFPVQPYLIGRGILPVAAKMVIAGGPKGNKSFIAMNMAMDLALGRDLFGAYYKNGTPVFPVAKKCRVLYIEQEIGDVGLQERLKGVDGKPGLLTGASPELMEWFIKTRDTSMRLDVEEGRDLLYREVESVKPDVVILDPMTKFHLLDENSAQEMAVVGRVGDHFIEKTGCSVVWIHHTSKPPSSALDTPRSGGDRLRGSSAIFADVDTVMLVDLKSSEKAPEPVIALDFILRRGTPIGQIYVRRMRDGRIQYEPDLEWSSKSERVGKAYQRGL
jgi:regulatory protein RepA